VELNSRNLHPTSSNLPPVCPVYWTKTRQEIHYWLNLNTSSLANLYEGAVHLIFGIQIPGRLRFISHAVREIRNRLPDSIPKITERLEYKNEVQNLADIWESNGFGLDEIPLGREEITINSQVFSKIQQLIKKHKAVPHNNKKRTFLFFELCISENKLDQNILDPIVNHYWEITEWFMEQTHDSGKLKLDPDDLKICHQFELFESFLATFSQNFYTTVDKLDEILQEDNSPQIEKVIGFLIHPQHFSHFFKSLQNPEWIKPLKDKGFFNNPPQIIEDVSQGTVRFPMWSQSRYLARMAKHKPKEVLEIALQIESNNPHVHEDFVDAALQMPSDEAVKLVPTIKTWIESLYSSSLLPEKVATFIVHLAKGGQIKKALELARTLLFIMPDSSLNNGNNNVSLSSPKARIRFHNTHYRRILQTSVPELVDIVGEKALIMLIFLLNDAIKFSICDPETEEDQNNLPILEDYSRIWRYAIEDHYRNHHPYDVREILIEAVRDSAKQILQQDRTKIRNIVHKLEECRWRIFHRIALYLISEYKDTDSDLLTEKLMERKRFMDTSFYEDYEYAHLLKDNFPQLPVEKQEQILSWIENHELDYSWLEDQEKKAEWVRYWQWSKLTIIKDSLPVYWCERYENLVKEFGNIELSNIVSGGVSEVRVLGVESPKTDLELESMSIEELVTFLRKWEPNSTDRFEEPSRSGLGSALARLSEKNPERYAQGAAQFQGLHARYISNLLRGLRQALNNQSRQQQEIREFDWISVLSLCNWLAEKSEELKNSQTIYKEPSSNWLEPCRTVLDLLGVGLNLDTIAIQFNFRNQVWNILRLLTQHPDPTPEREMGYHSSNNSYSELAINTVRGEAMHTVVRYALWIRRHFEQMPESAYKLARGFDEMPEVREVLDDHLNLKQDPSLAIRSVYGRWFPWLALLDPLWAEQNVEIIFPQDKSFSKLRLAVWESYITFCPAYDDVFNLLHKEYRYAVEQIDRTSTELQNLTHADESLAKHLMTLYWRGKIKLDEPEGLLAKFFELSSDGLRGYAIEFIGRSLKNKEDEIEPQTLNSLQLLWEKRLETAHNSTERISYTTELAAFGWWFSSGKFNDAWAITQIKQILELIGTVEPDFLVLERLAIIVDTMPESSVECLELIIKNDKSGWRIYSWQNETRAILSKAIHSNSDKAIKVAKCIIQDLGKRGQWEYRDLLPPSGSE
jgi:hypothetical protein